MIQIPGSTVEQLYTRARSWVVVTFSDANAALKVQDKENGALMGKGIGRLTWWDGIGLKEGKLNFTFQIDCKEGRYRLVMNGLEAVPDPKYPANPRAGAWFLDPERLARNNGKPNKMAYWNLEQLHGFLQPLAESLRKTMLAEGAKKSEW